MTAPQEHAVTNGASPPLTPERWRAVDAVLKGALSCDPARRDEFVTAACAGDDALRREVASLLKAHEGMGDFLEKPAGEAMGVDDAVPSLIERLTRALAGRYDVLRELGLGGMATVYLAHDVRHDRRVAIKVLREQVAATVGAERFLEEIRLTASLQHPHTLPLFDSGSSEGLLWYVMPFVDGETLRVRLAREGCLPVDTAVTLAREMSDALEHAHRSGIVHRDVKPENVLLQGGHAMIADFGIALALERAGGERLTKTGITLGTPQYMAPEQAAEKAVVDARADVYALGAVLYEMLTGESPFAAASRQATVRRLMSEPAIAPSVRRADVPPFLDAAVTRAMAKQPEGRFQSAAAFGAALASPRQIDPQSRRMVSARTMVCIALATAVAGFAGGWMLARQSPLDSWRSAPGAILPSFGGAETGSVAGSDGLSLSVVDRAGRPQRSIQANRPWTPRFSPDGRFVAYGAFGSDRSTSDIWVTDLDAGTTLRVTDDENDSNDPQWSADGARLAFSANAPGGKDIVLRDVRAGGTRVLAARAGTQFPSDWLHDGTALFVTEQGQRTRRDILVQPADGSTPWPYAASTADEAAARASPDGRWVAYVSDESGQAEVYLDSYPRPGSRVRLSSNGGVDPVWRRDGRELYYWQNDVLVAVELGAATGSAAPAVRRRVELFRAPYHGAANTMYDVSPDGNRFVIVQRAESGE